MPDIPSAQQQGWGVGIAPAQFVFFFFFFLFFVVVVVVFVFYVAPVTPVTATRLINDVWSSCRQTSAMTTTTFMMALGAGSLADGRGSTTIFGGNVFPPKKINSLLLLLEGKAEARRPGHRSPDGSVRMNVAPVAKGTVG